MKNKKRTAAAVATIALFGLSLAGIPVEPTVLNTAIGAGLYLIGLFSPQPGNKKQAGS